MNGLDGSLWNWMSVGILRAKSDHQLNGVNHQDLDLGWAQKWKQEKYGKRSCIFGLHKTQQWSSTLSLLCHTSTNVPFSASVSIFRFHNSGWFLCFAQCLGIASTALGNASVPVLAGLYEIFFSFKPSLEEFEIFERIVSFLPETPIWRPGDLQTIKGVQSVLWQSLWRSKPSYAWADRLVFVV